MTDTQVIRIEKDLIVVIRRYSDGSISDGIRAMHRIITESEGRMVSTEEVAETVRKVCQIEGVMLHERQKGFFRDLFGTLLSVITKERP
jgi:hypothetical protein